MIAWLVLWLGLDWTLLVAFISVGSIFANVWRQHLRERRLSEEDADREHRERQRLHDRVDKVEYELDVLRKLVLEYGKLLHRKFPEEFPKRQEGE